MDVFYALAEPKRREIIELVANKGKLSATEISHNFRITPQAVSQHLKVLRQANLLLMEKHAQRRMYKINPEAVQEVERWAKKMEDLWNEKLDMLEEVIKEEMKDPSKKRG